MNQSFARDARGVFPATLALALLAGFFLRTYLLADQVLMDDEWHGFYYALGKSPGWLLTHFSIPGATCIPLNFYTWCLGALGGWSETRLRLPSLICGVLCVAVCPLLARKIIGSRRAAWLALLLAVSPILIFYSRICRPYSAVALLGFAAILFAAHWLQSGGWRPALMFGVAGVLAVYFHLFAAVTVAAPVLVAIIFHARAFFRKSPPPSGPPLRQWLWVAAAMSVAGAVLILPALVHSMQSTFFSIALKGAFKLESLPRVALLISGTGSPVLAVLFWLLAVVGAVDLCRRHPWFGVTLAGLFPLHALALIASRPDCAQSAIVLTRYCIPLVPVSLLFVACGLEKVFEYLASRVTLRPALQTFVALAGVAALVAAGPLPQAYVAPNNFTSHGAYQHRYAPMDWSHSFHGDLAPADFTATIELRAEEVSNFYRDLGKTPSQRAVVEYPMVIGDDFSPFYFYQYFHRRPVIAGYTTGTNFLFGLATGNVYASTYFDQVLSLVENPARLKFQNLVSMDDLAAMRMRQVEYIILHKRFEAQLPLFLPPPPGLARLIFQYQAKLGAPAYEDANIVVFRVK